jgi:flagellar motor component MotA
MELIKATNGELVELLKSLQNIGAVKSTRFAILAARNVKELERVLMSLEEMATPSKEFQAVAAEAHKLADAEDKEGIEALEEKHQDLIEERKAQIAKLEEEMQKEAEVYLHKFKENQLPEDLTAEQVMPLLALIES